MNIAIFGLGYVGLANAAYLSSFHHVRGFDIDEIKIQKLQEGDPVLAEPNLQKTLKENASRLMFTWDPAQALEETSMVLFALPTPSQADGSPDLSHIFEAAEVLYKLAPQHIVLVLRSTVPPGTHQRLITYFSKHGRPDIHVISAPEFLRQNHIIEDIARPSRLVVGGTNETIVKQVIQTFRYGKDVPIQMTSPVNAELIKYASNAFLATKISFINEMSRFSELFEGDIDVIAEGMGFDPRIGSSFLKAGIGFGGSCFPKDLQTLNHVASTRIDAPIIRAVLNINSTQVQKFMDRFFKRMKSIKHKKIAVLGLSFKGDTLDVRNSLAYDVVNRLVNHQAKIFAYDPRSTLMFFEGRSDAPCIAYTEVLEEALKDADAVIICNDDSTIQKLKSHNFIKLMKKALIFDGKNLFNPKLMSETEYYSIGRANPKQNNK